MNPDGRTLTFGVAPGAKAPERIRDEETGTIWAGLTGTAIEGTLKGVRLQQVPATYPLWFGWIDYYPKRRYTGRLSVRRADCCGASPTAEMS